MENLWLLDSFAEGTELDILIDGVLEEKEPLQSNYPQMIAEILYRSDQPGNNPIW